MAVNDYCLNCKNYTRYRGFITHKICSMTEEDVTDVILEWIMKVGCRSFILDETKVKLT